MSDEDRNTKQRTRRDAAPRGRVEIVTASETVLWQHAPAAPTRGSGAGAVRPQGLHRGRGPRSYVRSPARIYEDLCDRLTDNPFIDASDIEVTVAGTEVTLSGTVRDTIAMRQAQAIAEEVAGITHVHNRLLIREAGAPETTPGAAVNQAVGTIEKP
jgi:osmotically-inducible protein OsmY